MQCTQFEFVNCQLKLWTTKKVKQTQWIWKDCGIEFIITKNQLVKTKMSIPNEVNVLFWVKNNHFFYEVVCNASWNQTIRIKHNHELNICESERMREEETVFLVQF